MRKRRRPRPQPDRALSLAPITLACPECQHRLLARYNNFRTITTLDGVLRLTLAIRRCPNPDCARFRQPYRPEAEPHFALPYHEFGLDVMAFASATEFLQHKRADGPSCLVLDVRLPGQSGLEDRKSVV